MGVFDQAKQELTDLEVRLERRITAKGARKLARVHLLVAADNEDDPKEQANINAALTALGE